MTQEALTAILLSPRKVATGDPAGAALENVNTDVLGDGALCYVTEGAGKGQWQLQKDSEVPADGQTIVAPIAGPGRWFLQETSPVVVDLDASSLDSADYASEKRVLVVDIPPGGGTVDVDLGRVVGGLEAEETSRIWATITTVGNFSDVSSASVFKTLVFWSTAFTPGPGDFRVEDTKILANGSTLVPAADVDGASPEGPRLSFTHTEAARFIAELDLSILNS